jgi:hypothetical protein
LGRGIFSSTQKMLFFAGLESDKERKDRAMIDPIIVNDRSRGTEEHFSVRGERANW